MTQRYDFRGELHDGSDKLIELKDFFDATDEDNKTAITGATVTFDATDESDESAIVTGVSMPDQGGGLYQGVLVDTISVAVGDRIRIDIHANGGAGLQLERRGLLVVV